MTRAALRDFSDTAFAEAPPIFSDMGQDQALIFMRDQIEEGSMESSIVELARVITRDCPARDDMCELQHIYDALKKGRADLKKYGLARGFRYVADSRAADQYSSAAKILRMLARGANGGDCDDATILLGSLAAAVGFRVGSRGYGPLSGDGELVHVYPVALIPKEGPWKTDKQGRPDESQVVGLDITVPEASVGWQPPEGVIITAWTD